MPGNLKFRCVDLNIKVMRIMEFGPKWVHMARYELILKLDGALWLSLPISPPRVDSSKGPNRVNRAHWPTKEKRQILCIFGICSVHGQKWSGMAPNRARMIFSY